MFWQLWKKGSRNPIIGNWVRLAAERLWFCRIRFKQWGLHGGHRIADDSQVYQSSLVAQTGKHLPTMQRTWVRSLGQEDPVQKEMATHCSTLAWKILCAEERGRLQSMGSQRVRQNWATSLQWSKVKMPRQTLRGKKESRWKSLRGSELFRRMSKRLIDSSTRRLNHKVHKRIDGKTS